ncbi:MAG: hypothetical protein ACR2NN_20205 [Bryobacteraceae bacterium]
MRVQPWHPLWAAFGASYGSGLPVEIDPNADVDPPRQQYGSRLIDRVNFARERVRRSFSLDASLGTEFRVHERRKVRLQADVQNITDRLNAINFAGLFSGTAVAPPRSFGLRAQSEF